MDCETCKYLNDTQQSISLSDKLQKRDNSPYKHNYFYEYNSIIEHIFIFTLNIRIGWIYIGRLLSMIYKRENRDLVKICAKANS